MATLYWVKEAEHKIAYIVQAQLCKKGNINESEKPRKKTVFENINSGYL